MVLLSHGQCRNLLLARSAERRRNGHSVALGAGLAASWASALRGGVLSLAGGLVGIVLGVDAEPAAVDHESPESPGDIHTAELVAWLRHPGRLNC